MRMDNKYIRRIRSMSREQLEQTALREASIRGDAEVCLFHLGHEMWREDVLPIARWPEALRATDDRGDQQAAWGEMLAYLNGLPPTKPPVQE